MPHHFGSFAPVTADRYYQMAPRRAGSHGGKPLPFRTPRELEESLLKAARSGDRAVINQLTDRRGFDQLQRAVRAEMGRPFEDALLRVRSEVSRTQGLRDLPATTTGGVPYAPKYVALAPAEWMDPRQYQDWLLRKVKEGDTRVVKALSDPAQLRDLNVILRTRYGKPRGSYRLNSGFGPGLAGSAHYTARDGYDRTDYGRAVARASRMSRQMYPTGQPWRSGDGPRGRATSQPTANNPWGYGEVPTREDPWGGVPRPIERWSHSPWRREGVGTPQSAFLPPAASAAAVARQVLGSVPSGAGPLNSPPPPGREGRESGAHRDPNSEFWKRYNAYMASPAWRAKQQQFRSAQPGGVARCAVCGRPHGVQLHHTSYRRLGGERVGDLMALCKTHHDQMHSYLKANGLTVEASQDVARNTRRNPDGSYSVLANSAYLNTRIPFGKYSRQYDTGDLYTGGGRGRESVATYRRGGAHPHALHPSRRLDSFVDTLPANYLAALDTPEMRAYMARHAPQFLAAFERYTARAPDGSKGDYYFRTEARVNPHTGDTESLFDAGDHLSPADHYHHRSDYRRETYDEPLQVSRYGRPLWNEGQGVEYGPGEATRKRRGLDPIELSPRRQYYLEKARERALREGRDPAAVPGYLPSYREGLARRDAERVVRGAYAESYYDKQEGRMVYRHSGAEGVMRRVVDELRARGLHGVAAAYRRGFREGLQDALRDPITGGSGVGNLLRAEQAGDDYGRFNRVTFDPANPDADDSVLEGGGYSFNKNSDLILATNTGFGYGTGGGTRVRGRKALEAWHEGLADDGAFDDDPFGGRVEAAEARKVDYLALIHKAESRDELQRIHENMAEAFGDEDVLKQLAAFDSPVSLLYQRKWNQLGWIGE